jgi:hypothetical protein
MTHPAGRLRVQDDSMSELDLAIAEIKRRNEFVAPPVPEVCATCRWWHKSDYESDMPDDGRCGFADMTQRFWTEGSNFLTARVHTAADFGCQGWEGEAPDIAVDPGTGG